VWQMKQRVDEARLLKTEQPPKQREKLRADSGQTFQAGEKRIKDGRAHASAKLKERFARRNHARNALEMRAPARL
jgi:hypothetical protein